MRALVAALILLAGLNPALADGRADWSGYDWRATPFKKCLELIPDGCLFHHAKWDWKRNQWVDLAYSRAPAGLTLSLRLTNNDRADDDYVCVTVLFLDADGKNLGAYHVNLHIDPKSVVEDVRTVVMPATSISRIATIEIGSKQCRKGPHEDDAVFAAVLAALTN